MNQIVKITSYSLNGEPFKAVNARELWEKLGSKQDFSHWIKSRLSGYTEWKDYVVFQDESRDENGRFAPIDYIISLEVAEFCCILAKNKVGQKIRLFLQNIEEKEKSNLSMIQHFIDHLGTEEVLRRLFRA